MIPAVDATLFDRSSATSLSGAGSSCHAPRFLPIAQALSPWLFGMCLDRYGAGALALSTALGLVAFGVLMLLGRAPRQARPG